MPAVEKPKSIQVNIRLREHIKKRLEAVAAAELRSMSDQADYFIERALDAWDVEQAKKKPGK